MFLTLLSFLLFPGHEQSVSWLLPSTAYWSAAALVSHRVERRKEGRCSSSSSCSVATNKSSHTDRGDGERRYRKNDDDSDGAGEEPKDTSAGQPAGRSAWVLNRVPVRAAQGRGGLCGRVLHKAAGEAQSQQYYGLCWDQFAGRGEHFIAGGWWVQSLLLSNLSFVMMTRG